MKAQELIEESIQNDKCAIKHNTICPTQKFPNDMKITAKIRCHYQRLYI